jgi:hypothetical protein
LAALEKAKADKEAHGEFDSACPGYCGEPYRFCRRLRLLRDWSHDEIDEVFS